MAKAKTQFQCSKCRAVSSKWGGQCAACGEWNTLEEVAMPAAAPKGAPARQGYAGGDTGGPVTLDKVTRGSLRRIGTGLNEFDRVLGGGMALGGSVILGGNPGAGKSTLLLQTACHVADGQEAIYCTGEESLEQLRDRADRLSLPTGRLRVVAATDVTAIAAYMETARDGLVIVDSIQTLYHPELEGEPGNVSQVRTCASFLNRAAKRLGIALFFVGHITKNEALAGPQTLMHIVDSSLMLSSTEDARYRILRAEKNRFGPTSEIGVFAMTGTGLKVVENPSAIFLSRAVTDATGSIVTPLWEGTRPLLVEVQCLMDKSLLGNPRRVSVGIDDKRVAMLMAILHKHSGLQVADQDVFVNIVGGIRVLETSADLPVLLAAVSSFRGKVLAPDMMAFGEVGLSGEIRPSPNGQDRIREAAKLGFRKAFVPAANYPREGVGGIDIEPVVTLGQAIDKLMEL